jgi:hypothetical protein
VCIPLRQQVGESKKWINSQANVFFVIEYCIKTAAIGLCYAESGLHRNGKRCWGKHLGSEESSVTSGRGPSHPLAHLHEISLRHTVEVWRLMEVLWGGGPTAREAADPRLGRVCPLAPACGWGPTLASPVLPWLSGLRTALSPPAAGRVAGADRANPHGDRGRALFIFSLSPLHPSLPPSCATAPGLADLPLVGATADPQTRAMLQVLLLLTGLPCISCLGDPRIHWQHLGHKLWTLWTAVVQRA